jgi:DNA repair exonuclease SbcCD ATPase subunit
VLTARIEKGALIVSRKSVRAQEYAVDNKGDVDKTLIIEYPAGADTTYSSLETLERTDANLRFQGVAKAHTTSVLTITAENVRYETYALLRTDPGLLLTYSRAGPIPAAVRSALNRAMELKQAVTTTEREIADRTAQINDISQEQTRMRENMKVIAQSTQYYERLLAKLNEQESTIEKLQAERDSLAQRRDAEQKALEDYVATLTVE